VAALPSLRLAGSVPDAVVVAVPTRPGDDGIDIVGVPPGDVDGLLEREKAKGEPGELVVVPVARKAFLVGIGDGSPAAMRKAGAAVARRSKGSASLALDLRGLDLDPEGLHGLAEGLLLGVYGFTQKDSAEPRSLQDITVVVRKVDRLRPALDRALTVVRATATARDLVNTPSLEKTPAWLAAQATKLLKGLTVRVRDDEELRTEGWGGVTAVGMGSSRPPRVVEASWDGRAGGRGQHVVLVGKGITFDTGGISIKPNDGMLTMKMDMGGAAAVLATLRAVADLKLPVKVTVLACAAENMPSGDAQRPSDVITQYGGTTVEVLNTDAEGRLVLADGIAYADRVLKADVIVDIATLTGAMPIALGKKIAGLFTGDDALSDQLLAAADRSGERLWRLPLVEDYRQALESHTADLRNIGDPKLKLQGGSITAALFLREFAGGRSWAHLDIAGPAWSGGEDEELTKGGTGYGVRLLVAWLEGLASAPARQRRRSA
jgi:leucyl aminopeptidase